MCLHKESYWKEVTTKQGVFKIKVCTECGWFLDDVVIKAIPTPKDANQAFYDGMFKCIDVVKTQHPEFTDEVVSHYAISLFIQIARR